MRAILFIVIMLVNYWCKLMKYDTKKRVDMSVETYTECSGKSW